MSEASRDYNDIYMPTIPQQRVISILILPFCLLSFLGSAAIVRYVLKDKKRSAYRRLMLAISICDMISTIGFALHPFLGPADSIRPYVYYIGNDATCTVVGAFTQFSWASHLYTSSLSFYFLLTVRYGMRDEVFAKKLEPFIHFLVISFSVSTSIAGVFLDVYHESETSASCWVAAKPGEECWNDSCGAERIAWIFGGIPNIFCFFSVTFNNILLYRYVRRTIATSQKNALRAEQRILSREFSQERHLGESTYRNHTTNSESQPTADINQTKQDMSSSSESKESDAPRLFSSFRSSRPKSVLRSSDRQWERVRQVGVQSFLYVSSYILCFGPTVVRQLLDGRGLEKEDGAEKIFLPLLLIQCFLLPSQGTFFCIIFFRPKYLQNRKKQPAKPRIWAARSAMETDKHRPTAMKVSPKATKPHGLKAVDENNAVEDAEVPASLSEMSNHSSVDSVMPSVASRVERSRVQPSQGRRSIISILSGANNNNNSRSTATSSSSGVETTSISNASDLNLSSTSVLDESSSSSSPGTREPSKQRRYLRIDGFDVPVNSSLYST